MTPRLCRSLAALSILGLAGVGVAACDDDDGTDDVPVVNDDPGDDDTDG